jgi:beta-galactosidase
LELVTIIVIPINIKKGSAITMIGKAKITKIRRAISVLCALTMMSALTMTYASQGNGDASQNLSPAGWVIGEKTIDVNPGRIVESIDKSWTFYKNAQGVGMDFSSINFNDGGWEKINLPHTWNAVDGIGADRNYYRGDGWYRKQLNIPATYDGKKLFLQIKAASKESEVFVNGHSIHTNIGGYLAYTVDITKYAKFGQDNIIAIRVNNEVKDSAPLSGDFTIFGGLYRGVNLIVTDKTYIDLEDYGSNGVYVTIPNDKSIKEEAEVSVKVPVKIDQEDVAESIKVWASIKDADGNSIKSDKLKPANVAEGSTEFTGTLAVKKPHLWNGTKDPYLYTIEVTVIREGRVIDQVNEKVGFRYFTIDPQNGFILNGEKYPLHGVAIHQDRKGYGNAVPDEIRAEDFELLKEVGANTIRAAHYPHSQFVYNTADEMGLVVWAEIPLVNSMTATTAFSDNAEKQLTEMIKQNYNHPSIVTWGMSNEFGGLSGLSADEQYAKATELIKRLATKAKTLDPNRVTTHALQGSSSSLGTEAYLSTLKKRLAWNETAGVDIASLNTYFGWYYEKVGDLAAYLDKLHAEYPKIPLGISEYGGGANPYQHDVIDEDFINNWDRTDSRGPWQPEEFQNYLHENDYKIISERPWLWSTHIWNMFDFGVAGKNEATTPGINTKGIVSHDRQLKKDSFYFYKAQWNKTESFLYLTSKRYTERNTDTIDIKVYSNVGLTGSSPNDYIRLNVNGEDIGIGEKQQPGVYVWKNVKIKPENNVVTAQAYNGSEDKPISGLMDQVNTWRVTSGSTAN